MGANTGVRSPGQRVPSVRHAVDGLRAELDDPLITALAIAALTLLTFSLVRITGGAPSAIMELGYAPVALAAYVFGWRGGLVVGILVAAALGPVPALLGFDRVEGPAEWLIRGATAGGIGVLIGRLLDRTGTVTVVARDSVVELASRHREGLIALATAAEARDTDGGEHVRRVEMIARRLAHQAGTSISDAAEIGWASMFHDIGKLRVPERILVKPEPLDPDEWTVIRLHPIWSEQALAGGEDLAMARAVARWHHENWDGSGYPDGLYGDRIPLAARIVRIADAFDSMTNRRPYQEPRSFEAAIEELQANAGRDYDPGLVQHFVELLRHDAALRTELTDLRLV
jgi:HD-GYP domain-containing protein (c-di-GMP phosphodiesterase class II)